MRKILLLITCFLLILSFYSSVFTSDENGLVGSDKQAIKDKLAPYQTVIDKINKEYGSSINIPDDGLFEVYNNVKDIPLDKFEADLRRDYEMVKDTEREIYVDAEGNMFNKQP